MEQRFRWTFSAGRNRSETDGLPSELSTLRLVPETKGWSKLEQFSRESLVVELFIVEPLIVEPFVIESFTVELFLIELLILKLFILELSIVELLIFVLVVAVMFLVNPFDREKLLSEEPLIAQSFM